MLSLARLAINHSHISSCFGTRTVWPDARVYAIWKIWWKFHRLFQTDDRILCSEISEDVCWLFGNSSLNADQNTKVSGSACEPDRTTHRTAPRSGSGQFLRFAVRGFETSSSAVRFAVRKNILRCGCGSNNEPRGALVGKLMSVKKMKDLAKHTGNQTSFLFESYMRSEFVVSLRCLGLLHVSFENKLCNWAPKLIGQIDAWNNYTFCKKVCRLDWSFDEFSNNLHATCLLKHLCVLRTNWVVSDVCLMTCRQKWYRYGTLLVITFYEPVITTGCPRKKIHFQGLFTGLKRRY